MPMGIGLGIGVTRGGGVGWWPAGSELAFEFDNGRGFNSIDRTKTTPDSILTYTNPSAKLVYGSDGVLRYAPHNLLLQSQTFETASWSKSGVAVTGASINAAVAPDGTLTADKVVATNTANAERYIFQSFTASSSNVFTVYAKDEEYYLVRVIELSAYKFYATFNLVTGLVSAAGGANYLSSSMTDVGGGWWRLTIFTTTITGTLVSSFVGFPDTVTPTNAPASYAGDGVSGVYFWGAQLQRTPNHSNTYIPTTTAAVYSLPIDHNPTTFEPLGVLIEEQRTNLILQSQTFGTTWAPTSASISANAGVAPDGTTTADKLIGAAASAVHFLVQTVAISNATVYTYSVYAKKVDGARYLNLAGPTAAFGAGNFVGFDLQTGVVLGSPVGFTGVIQDIGGGWYRCIATSVASASTTGDFFIVLSDGSLTRAPVYTPNGTDGVLLWGAQLE